MNTPELAITCCLRGQPGTLAAKIQLCFASGLAAIDAVIKLLKPGDGGSDLYGGTYRIFAKVFENYIRFKFIGMENAQNIEDPRGYNTKHMGGNPTNHAKHHRYCCYCKSG